MVFHQKKPHKRKKRPFTQNAEMWKQLDDAMVATLAATQEGLTSKEIWKAVRKAEPALYKKLPHGTVSSHLFGIRGSRVKVLGRKGKAFVYVVNATKE